MFGLYILGGLLVAIFVMAMKRRQNEDGFSVALRQCPFRFAAELPSEWPQDLAGFVPRSGVLIEGRPPALLLVGHLKGGSVVVAGAARTALDDYLGFAFPADWKISAGQFSELVRIAKPDISRFIGAGECVLLWRRNHIAEPLHDLIAKARHDVFEVLVAGNDAKSAPALQPPGVVTPPSDPPKPSEPVASEAPLPAPASNPVTKVAQASLPASPTVPDDVFESDNEWGWRKEGDMGYMTLPPGALQPKIRVIFLAWHEMQFVPAEIGLLENLEEVTLDHTELKELPEKIGMCAKLKCLRVMHSKLKKIPISIGKLPKLEVLDFDDNDIEVLPEEIGQLITLRELNVSGNYIKKVPASVGGLARLEVLEVACTSLKSLPESVANLRNLRKLVVWNGFPETEKWKKMLPETEVSYPV